MCNLSWNYVHTGKTFETTNPTTEEIITRVAEGTKEDVDLAVKAARNAFDHGPWPRLSGQVCCAYMYVVRWYLWYGDKYQYFSTLIYDEMK